jgi:type VI secretion system protein ImpC
MSGVFSTDHLDREFKPRSEAVREELKRALETLAQAAIGYPALMCDHATTTIEQIIRAIDSDLSKQLNLILHHPDFQILEAGWRGLHHLVTRSHGDERLKIKIMSITKQDLACEINRYRGITLRASAIYSKLCVDAFALFGEEPFSLLIGDYYFDRSQSDIGLLACIAQIAAAAHVPFITGASPAIVRLHTWKELSHDLPEESGAWRALRDMEEARFIGLAMPRFLSRLPYGRGRVPDDVFELKESEGKYAWANAAYALGIAVAHSFRQSGWFNGTCGVESQGAVDGLPLHAFHDDEGIVEPNRPTEVALQADLAHRLARAGLMPFVHRSGSDFGVFPATPSLSRSPEYGEPQMTANTKEAANLPYLLACCRLVHHMRCFLRDTLHSDFTEIETRLRDWVEPYVDADPAHSSEDSQARRPFAAASIKVEAANSRPDIFQVRVWLRPHHQFKSMTASMRLAFAFPP